MSSKLFAFNVSKKIEKVDEKAPDQWVGDQVAHAACVPCYCSSYGYGALTCFTNGGPYCYLIGPNGYYICDNA